MTVRSTRSLPTTIAPCSPPAWPTVVVCSLDEGVPVVTVSRPAHRVAVDELLAACGVDADRARRDGRLTTLDADESMARFMVDGHPDPDLFAAFVAALVPTDGRRPVSAFGEMVALLWERGEVAAALELESLWNTALARHPVRLLCAYSWDLLADAELADVATMCGLHDHVSLAGPHPVSGAATRDGDVVRSSVHLPVPAAVGSVRGFVREALTGGASTTSSAMPSSSRPSSRPTRSPTAAPPSEPPW